MTVRRRMGRVSIRILRRRRSVVLVMMSIVSRIFSLVVVTLAVVPLFMRQQRQRGSSGIPTAAATRLVAAMGGGRCDDLLACVIQRTETRTRLTVGRVVVPMRGLAIHGDVTMTIVIGSVLASAGFFVSASFLVAKEGRNIAIVTSPATRTDASNFSFGRASLLGLSKCLSGIVHVVVRRRTVHVMVVVMVITRREGWSFEAVLSSLRKTVGCQERWSSLAHLSGEIRVNIFLFRTLGVVPFSVGRHHNMFRVRGR
mmetsp:Transcript_3162/g.6035  ORF Transcript_3162/g.6035 Transcript_3162/m.6035 type:complete len:256 (-) Transcript_3162:357-1124(-)